MSTEHTDNTEFLVDHFLIAMPQLQDSYFANTVVYIWRHSEEGALGLVINLPIKLQLHEIFAQLDMQDERSQPAPQIVLSGGPVETEKGFVLHDSPPDWPSSLRITDTLTLTTSREILGDIARRQGPDNYLITLGCSGWSPGQLEKELGENTWFTCPANRDIIFSTDFPAKPDMAAATLGFSISQLASNIGFA